MDGLEVQKALDSSVELQITVTGRKSGREFSTPVWFVREGKTIYLMPVKGSKNQWYKNVLKSRRIKISSGKVSIELAAKPINDLKTANASPTCAVALDWDEKTCLTIPCLSMTKLTLPGISPRVFLTP